MRKVKCKSGVTGFQCRLQKNYSSFEEFEQYSLMYGIAKRLGFKSDKEAWDINPRIEMSVIPSDLRIVG